MFVAKYLDDLPEIFKIKMFFSIISAHCFCRYDVMAVRRRYMCVLCDGTDMYYACIEYYLCNFVVEINSIETHAYYLSTHHLVRPPWVLGRRTAAS